MKIFTYYTYIRHICFLDMFYSCNNIKFLAKTCEHVMSSFYVIVVLTNLNWLCLSYAFLCSKCTSYYTSVKTISFLSSSFALYSSYNASHYKRNSVQILELVKYRQDLEKQLKSYIANFKKCFTRGNKLIR